MSKTIEIRCSNTRDKGAEKVICRRYLGEIDENRILIICPRCGRKYLIEFSAKGIKAVKLRHEVECVSTVPTAQEKDSK